MPLFLLLMFPLAEIAAFILVGKAIGVAATLALVIASSAIGLIMLRDAGVATAARLQLRQKPSVAILREGGARLLAGLLFLVPGFLTDLAGLLILIAVGSGRIASDSRVAPAESRNVTGNGAAMARSEVIDGDFRRLDG